MLELHGPRVVFGEGQRAGAGFAVLGGTRAVGCWTLLELRTRQLNGGTPEDVATTCLSVGDLVGFETLQVAGQVGNRNFTRQIHDFTITLQTRRYINR